MNLTASMTAITVPTIAAISFIESHQDMDGSAPPLPPEPRELPRVQVLEVRGIKRGAASWASRRCPWPERSLRRRDADLDLLLQVAPPPEADGPDGGVEAADQAAYEGLAQLGGRGHQRLPLRGGSLAS